MQAVTLSSPNERPRPRVLLQQQEAGVLPQSSWLRGLHLAPSPAWAGKYGTAWSFHIPQDGTEAGRDTRDQLVAEEGDGFWQSWEGPGEALSAPQCSPCPCSASQPPACPLAKSFMGHLMPFN